MLRALHTTHTGITKIETAVEVVGEETPMISETQIGARLAKMFQMTGKIAVVTGAAQGLGRQVAQLLAELGASVVLADLNFEGVQKAAAEIEAMGGVVEALRVDIGDELSIKALFESVNAKFGRLDVLVNAAADRAKTEMFDMSVAQWDHMIAVTLRGAFLTCREAISRMVAKGEGGSIINISSVSSVRPTLWGINVHYDAAKSGLDGLTRTLASEFAGANIRVNTINPGGMASEGGAKIAASYNVRGPIMGTNRFPMGRLASTLEVAQAVAFLASPASPYITGQMLAVDGGYMVS